MVDSLRTFSFLAVATAGTKLDFFSAGCGDAVGSCSECRGMCFEDGQCKGATACFKRDDDTAVPGCEKGGFGDVPGFDYCAVLPRALHFEMVGCYKSNAGGRNVFGTDVYDVGKNANGKYEPIPECKKRCMDSCYMGIEKDTSGKMKCLCSDNPDLNGRGVGLFECGNHKDVIGVDCIDTTGSITPFGCGGVTKLSVFVNSDKASDKCKSKSIWPLPDTLTKKTKSCTKTMVKAKLTARKSHILNTRDVDKLFKELKDPEAQCAKWCEMEYECGCHVVDKNNKCNLMRWGYCAAETGGTDKFHVCNKEPPRFQLIGCYSKNFGPSQGTEMTNGGSVVECMKFCKGTCYMAIQKGKECVCFDQGEGDSKMDLAQCDGKPKLSVDCIVTGGCGGDGKRSVYVNSLGGAQCSGLAPWSNHCSYKTKSEIGGYSLKKFKVASAEICRVECENDANCGCFSFTPAGSGMCALKPKGLACKSVVTASTVTHVSGQCGQYFKTLVAAERLPHPMDFDMVGCYPEKSGNGNLFAKTSTTVSGLEECKQLCRNKCYMGLHESSCFCSDNPSWPGSSRVVEACNAPCKPEKGCGGKTSDGKEKFISVYSNVVSKCKSNLRTGSPWAVQDFPPKKTSKTCEVLVGASLKSGCPGLSTLGGIASADKCRRICETNVRCKAYIHKASSSTCYLRGPHDPGYQKPCEVLWLTDKKSTAGRCNSLPLNFMMIGCFVNGGKRQHAKVTSPDKCAMQCKFSCWMGIQKGDECTCSDSLTFGAEKEKECTSKKNQCTKGLCGGNGRDTVYFNMALKDSSRCKNALQEVRKKNFQPFWYLGCYKQVNTGKRNFEGKNEADAAGKMKLQTPASCMRHCKGFCFMAIQNGDECRCDDKPPFTDTTRMKLIKDELCGTKRSENEGACFTYGCGGGHIDSVYVNSDMQDDAKCKKVPLTSQMKLSDYIQKQFVTWK